MKSTKKKILVAGVAAAAVGVVGAVLYKMLKEIDAMMEIDRETAEGYYPFGFDSDDKDDIFGETKSEKRMFGGLFKKSRRLKDMSLDNDEYEDDDEDTEDDFSLDDIEKFLSEDEDEDIFSDDDDFSDEDEEDPFEFDDNELEGLFSGRSSGYDEAVLEGMFSGRCQ